MKSRTHTPAPPRPLRALGSVFTILRWILAVTTAFALVFGVLVLVGVGTVTLPGVTEEVRPVLLAPGEYQTEVDGEMRDVAETTVFESDDGTVTFGPTQVEVGTDDQIVIRIVAVGFIWVLIALAWMGVVQLAAVVNAAVAGDVFDSSNALRLRRAGWVGLAVPLVTVVGAVLLSRLSAGLDLAGPEIRIDISVAGWWVWIIAGLALLSLAEVFERGTALRDFEELTV